MLPELQERSSADQLPQAFEWACFDEKSGTARPRRVSEIARKVFGDGNDDLAITAALSAIALQPPHPDAVSFRAHMFVRNVRGV